jgi:hypothetical protein
VVRPSDPDASDDGTAEREALAHSSRNSARSALYLAPARLLSEPDMTVSPPAVRTHHFHLLPLRRFSTMSKTANGRRRPEESCNEPLPQAFPQSIEETLLPLDPVQV